MPRIRLLVLPAVLVLASSASAGVYYGFAQHGGTWADANKSVLNSDDDYMCWAASAANVLTWTHVAAPSGLTDADQVFSYFQQHWSNDGGMMAFGWKWWFDGTNPAQGVSGWAQVESAGGNFYPTKSINNYFRREATDSLAMVAVDQFLHDRMGVSLGIYTDSGGGHAITAWGYATNDSGSYSGLYVTDSDDGVTALRYYDVTYSQADGGRWYLQNLYGTSDTWYIGEVQGLTHMPEPGAVALAALGSLLLLRRRRNSRAA
jgi:MYXO-CTERM domain-containing protein